ncbi:MAG: signal recognition particle-docking protein FtsY [Candidatus Aminicenantes bacterium RBG_13_62_12]|nr:MAG: signal recognition particle-docking protein FtsY [Candidatus Aminicenantes bacterium RBG_13_62_12]
MRKALSRTREAFKLRLSDVFRSGKGREETLDALEEALLLSDAGPAVTARIIDNLRRKSQRTDSPEHLARLLRDEIHALLAPVSGSEDIPVPFVLMMVGANGGGKTTAAAKVAYRLKSQGRTVLLAAADTFRAAASEQTELWGKKLDIPVVRGQHGADPAAVVYDAIQSLKARGFQTLVIDTAGRLHTNHNLMQELDKIRRITAREIPGAPHEALLVLDAGIGQNSLIQAREFLKFSGLTGVFLAKMDGTAKGGSVLSIADELRLPIKYIGTGEGEEDLAVFSSVDFVDALLS